MRNRLKAIERTIKATPDDDCNPIVIYNKGEPLPKPHKNCKDRLIVFLPHNNR